ncbi:transmembrane protein, putative [Bodo saltans]|uniref:Transmembrane protein, putative n=1 Tax=Bodo saltans TaxID=75058 RepID=A0A0S4J2N7_BODSA|nr:transmembrane protein, putative [Bodo saltans]|eukprot:CUG62294.1 transmembrane protein, putative [Bodo saltans]
MLKDDENQHLINEVPEHKADQEVLLDSAPTRKIVCAVVPMFMGYAALVSFQSDIKDRLGIHSESSDESYAFGEAVSMLFLAALVFRLLHNVFLSWLSPRQRVFFGCALMCLATGTVAVVYYALRWTSVWLAYVIYVCGGIAIGTFEANLVSSITPLGHQTKKWAVIGMPLGYNGVSIGGFFLFALAPSNAYLQGGVFGATSLLCVVAACIFAIAVPSDVSTTIAQGTEFNGVSSLAELTASLREWREWIAPIAPNLVSLFTDMFACILASTVALYVFKVGNVPLVPGRCATMPYNVLQGVFNICGFLGDFTARTVAYSPPSWWPTSLMTPNGNTLRCLVFTCTGLALCLCRVAILSPIGMLLIMFGNGLMYATTTRRIDTVVPWKYNIIAVSLWLFTGDCGSYIASTLTTPISNAVGRVASCDK